MTDTTLHFYSDIVKYLFIRHAKTIKMQMINFTETLHVKTR